MTNFNFKLGFTLFILGSLGILSLLTVPIAMENLPPELLERFSENDLRWLSLLNPAILLLFSVITGMLLYKKVNLAVPVLESAWKGTFAWDVLKEQFKFALLGGILTGILLILLEQVFMWMVPQAFNELGANLSVTPAARILYGGFTEEILLRFGLMTFVVWLLNRVSKSLNPGIYWSGILLSAILFAAGHLPVVFQALGDPPGLFIFYILLGNSIGGTVYGWLYWKKGLEASFMAHIITHGLALAVGWIFL